MSVTASQLRLQGGVSTSSAQSAFLAGSSRLPVRPSRAAVACRPARLAVHAGNDYETGVFSPLVVAVRNVMGVKEFNQFRGKAISLHSQVITEFCKSIGADGKVRQGLIRLAKKNGGKLGFLA